MLSDHLKEKIAIGDRVRVRLKDPKVKIEQLTGKVEDINGARAKVRFEEITVFLNLNSLEKVSDSMELRK